MEKFDDIRPYYDSELPAAMRRIVASDVFPWLAGYVFPGKPYDEVKRLLLGLDNVADFQRKVMVPVNEQVIQRSISRFSYSGVEHVDRMANHLFVANHRDIMLDASLVQYVLVQNGYDTSEITFGANLMQDPVVVDIGKSNKMFRVERGGSMRDFYMSSRHLSEYIRHCITVKHQSVWIAQRNGRTKDGNDTTDQGVVKMFTLSYPDDKIRALDDLHILPICISYEWEPCDDMKAVEIYTSRSTRYIKHPGEDLHSIMAGISDAKGGVHIAFCPPVTHQELMQYNDLTASEYNRAVARLIDAKILSAYRLYPNNYIAHDLRYAQQRYSDRYTPQQREAFIRHMQRRLSPFDVEQPEVLRDIFLGIYSNPVQNKRKI